MNNKKADASRYEPRGGVSECGADARCDRCGERSKRYTVKPIGEIVCSRCDDVR